jgi:serine/threonine protein kinase
MTSKNAGSGGSKRPPDRVRDLRDPIPTTIEEVREELEYWEDRQGEGDSGSNFEEGVRNRLTTLRDRERRYREGSHPLSERRPTKFPTFHTAFNTYEVIGQPLGSGGAGTVYAVRDIDGGRYALKILNSKAGTAKTKRFQNEIAFCSKKNHANIITVFDHGVTSGLDGMPVPFYVMPLYPTTLRKQMRKGIPHLDVLRTFSQILDGVEAAHLKDVWHRDLKPENILCNEDENQVIIADFGIAKFEEEELHTAVETSNRERLANFVYSAPEQRVRGKAITSKADIFALGLILNEMFTGEVPQGSGYKRISAVSASHAFLDDLVDQMIQQEPEQRPDSVTTVKEELIGRGNQFISLQRLDKIKNEVVPESEINDPLVNDPIRLVEKEDYRKGVLVVKLNRAVNDKWVACFQNRATRFSSNVSSAMVVFRGDRVHIMVAEHFLQEGVRFVKKYLMPANEDYAAQVRLEHLKEIEQRKAAQRSRVAQEEARIKILQKITL